MTTKILIQTSGHGKMPFKATEGSAGYDIFAAEELILEPNKSAMVATGLQVEIPLGYELQIRSRSGLAAKNNVCVLNAPGTIDSDYRGEIKVILFNHGQAAFHIELGMRIAQMVLCKVPHAELVQVDSLSDTTRSAGGFGSTGVK